MYDLLWQTENVRLPVLLPTLYRAPSWSWASVDGALIFGGESAIDLHARLPCSILDASVELASSSPFVSVNSALMRVQAKLKRVPTESHLLSTPTMWHVSARAGLDSSIKVNGKLLPLMKITLMTHPTLRRSTIFGASACERKPRKKMTFDLATMESKSRLLSSSGAAVSSSPEVNPALACTNV